MTDMCGADHPDLPITCEYREDPTKHEEHMGFQGGELVEWANDGFTIQKVSNPKNNATRLASVANNVRDRERVPETLSDPTANTVGKMAAEPSDTSKAAAFAIRPKTGTQRARVLDAIHEAGEHGLTDEEARESLGLRYSSECARRQELVQGGWIIDSGERRPTSTGNAATVWIMSEAGLSKLS